MALAAHKKFLVTVVEAEEDGILYTVDGKIAVHSGELIAHDQLGGVSIMPKDYYQRNYVQVEKVRKHIDKEEMAKNYTQDWSMFEEEDYIERFQEKVRERNKLED
jgi:hypothetical protein